MATLTGELKLGCLVEIVSITRQGGQKIRNENIALFLDKQVRPSYDFDNYSVLRFLMPDMSIKEIWEDLFETTAHIYVRVIE
jgi:hypothetical protein